MTSRPSARRSASRGHRGAGQVAAVTGGSAGLGLAIAAALAQVGSAVVLASRSAGRCAAAAARLPARTGAVVRGQACDVTEEAAVAGLIDRILVGRGRLDVLVTSAGIPGTGAETDQVIGCVARPLDVQQYELNHTIWRYESERSRQ